MAARTPAIIALAGPRGNPVALVLGLMAKSVETSGLAAARVGRIILRGMDATAVADAMAAIGL